MYLDISITTDMHGPPRQPEILIITKGWKQRKLARRIQQWNTWYPITHSISLSKHLHSTDYLIVCLEWFERPLHLQTIYSDACRMWTRSGAETLVGLHYRDDSFLGLSPTSEKIVKSSRREKYTSEDSSCISCCTRTRKPRTLHLNRFNFDFRVVIIASAGHLV